MATRIGPAPRTEGGLRPALGVAWEGRPVSLLAAVADLVDVIEIVPDCLVGPTGAVDPQHLAELDRYAPTTPVTYHGIGLSIGSVSGWNADYFEVLETLLDWRLPLWHSEHLGFTEVDGSFLGTMGALPPTEEALDLVVERAGMIRDRYGLEFMLEHVATPLERPAGLTVAAFLNALAARTGCRLLLDLHNLECDQDNGLLDLEAFFDELNWAAVGEIHVAGGVWHDGHHLDVHSGTVAPSTLLLLERALPLATNLDLVVYEVLGAAVSALGTDAIRAELSSIGALLAASVEVGAR